MRAGMMAILIKAKSRETLEKLYAAWKDSLEAKRKRLRSELSEVEAELEELEEAYRRLKKEKGWE